MLETLYANIFNYYYERLRGNGKASMMKFENKWFFEVQLFVPKIDYASNPPDYKL